MAYYEHMAVLSDNEVKCTLCEDILQNSDRLLETHLHDRKHRELYMKSLMTANNIIISTTNLFCYICNCGIEISELISHVQSSIHQSKHTSIKDLVSLDGELVVLPEKFPRLSGPSLAYCTVCDRDVEFTQNSIKDHITSAKHKRGRAMVLQPLNGIFSVEGHDEYLWCKICQKFFDNYVELIFQHVEQSDHAKKMAKLLRLIDGQNIGIDNYLQNYKEDKVVCNKCDGIEVPCNVVNLQSHIRGKKHKEMK